MANREDTRIFMGNLWTVLAVLLLPLFVWIYWVAEEGSGLHDVVAIDQALVAGNIMEGRGMSSSVVTPLHTRFEGGIEKADPIFAKPALSLWEALWFQLAGKSVNTVIISSGIFFVFNAWLVFILGSRFHSTAAAWVCFLVFMLNPYVLDLSTCGRPEPMGMFFAGLLFLLLSGDPPEPDTYWIPWRTCFLSGVVAGALIQSVHYLMLPILVVISYYWYRWAILSAQSSPPETVPGEKKELLVAGTWSAKRLGIRLSFLFVLGVLLPAALVYLGRLFVDGPAPVPVGRFMMAVNTSVALGWSYWREYSMVDPSLQTFISMFSPSLTLKWLAGLSYGFTSIFDVFQPVVCALFILALFFPEYGESKGWRWMLFMLIALQVADMALFYWDSRFLAVWTPMVIVTGIGTFSEFLQQRFLAKQRARITALQTHVEMLKEEFILYYTPMLLLLVFTAGLLFLRLWDRTPPPMLRTTAAMDTMKKDPAQYEYIVTPAPWMVAWHTGARTLWMPEYEKTMKQLEEQFGPLMKTVYLPRNRAEILHDRVPSWWFLALRKQDMFTNHYQFATFSGFGEAVFLRKDTEEAK